MSIRRHAAKRDLAEPAIIDALEDIGVVVRRISQPDMPDLLTWTPREGFRLIEVKSPGEKLTIGQEVTRKYLPFAVITSVAEALALFGIADR